MFQSAFRYNFAVNKYLVIWYDTYVWYDAYVVYTVERSGWETFNIGSLDVPCLKITRKYLLQHWSLEIQKSMCSRFLPSVVIRSAASACLSVCLSCPVRAITFRNFDLETLFWSAGTSSERLRSSLYISRSRSQCHSHRKQNIVFVCPVWTLTFESLDLQT